MCAIVLLVLPLPLVAVRLRVPHTCGRRAKPNATATPQSQSVCRFDSARRFPLFTLPSTNHTTTATMAVWEGKKYKLESSDKFEDYMKELGECSAWGATCGGVACQVIARLPVWHLVSPILLSQTLRALSGDCILEWLMCLSIATIERRPTER